MDKVMGVVRAGLAAVGGFVVALGVLDADTWASILTNVETIIGAVMALGAAGASIYSKVKK